MGTRKTFVFDFKMVDLSTLLYILTAYGTGCYSARRKLTTRRSNAALSGPDNAKTICQKIRTLNQIPDIDCDPPRQLTHNFSQPLIAIVRLSRFLRALTCVTRKRITSLLHATLSPTHCQHLYDNKESTSNHTNNKTRSKHSGAYLGHGQSSPLVYHWRCFAAAAAAATQERLRKCKESK